jgi:chitinase
MKRLIQFILLCAFVHLSIQQQCSASNHCPEGCCSSAGFCGYGPDYCGKGCQSTCERKSQCNPGWDSSEYSEKDKCLLNVCCSEHGFCGYTEEFCKDDKVDRPKCSPTEKPINRVIGYYEAWAPAKRACYGMRPLQIPYGQYTDIIFSFATINPETFKVSAGDFQTEYMLSQMWGLKVLQPDIKLWIALGGWAFNDPGPTQTTFSDIASSAKNTKTFLDSLVSLMSKYSLDGVDIDWEYPVAEERHGTGADYKNVVTFMRQLRSRMKASKKLTSMAIPASYWYLRHFDIKALEAEVDWFNLMSYDMHGAWDIDNEWTGPWANSHTNMTEIQLALDLLWRNDINPSKVTMGMAFYSRSFTLTDPSCNKLGCRVSSGGNAGKCSDTVGVLLHPEIAEIVAEKKLAPVLDRTGTVKTVSWGNQWTTFDDIVTWRLKANTARSQCIQGFMVWALSQDDAKGTNIKALNSALGRKTREFPDFRPVDKTPEPMPVTNPKLCRWTNCFEGCPPGFKEIQRDGHEEIMMDRDKCPDVDYNQIGFTRFCCPSEHKLPTCTWRGHKNSGNCKPGCKDDEVEVGSLRKGCKKNHQSACCTKSPVTEAYGKCLWTDCVDKGSVDKVCGDKFMTSSPLGWGGHKECKSGTSRALCCENPPPTAFSTKCQWYSKVGHLKGGGLDYICEGACPQDSVMLARSRAPLPAGAPDTTCFGQSAFCCPDPKIAARDDEYEEETYSQKTAKQYKKLLENYMENPTCPRKELNPILHGDTSYAFDLVSRDVSCTIRDWESMISISTMMYTVAYVGFDVIRELYDEIFARSFHTELLFLRFENFLRTYLYDPGPLIEATFLNPTTAGTGMSEMRDTSQLCTYSGETMHNLAEEHDGRHKPKIKRRDEPQSLALRDAGLLSVRQPDKRIIWAFQTDHPDPDNEAYIPNLIQVLQGISRGHLSLHYARWEWFRGRDSLARRGPMLELAYWIGNNPGEDTLGNPDYDVYRDTSQEHRDNPDLWVVFHIHFESPPNGFDDQPDWSAHPMLFYRPVDDGPTYVGTPAISVFHANEWSDFQETPDDDVRVDGFDTQYTIRNVWRCPAVESPHPLWYIGTDPNTGDDSAELTTLLTAWGQRIHQEGYVGHTGLRLILAPPEDQQVSDSIDPHDAGWIVHSRRGWTEPGGGEGVSPYRRNFLIVDGFIDWQPYLDTPAPNTPNKKRAKRTQQEAS